MQTWKEPALRRRLDDYLAMRALPGLRHLASRRRFIKELLKSQKKLRAFGMRKFGGSHDASKKDFNPFRGIVHEFENGERDEALWLAFLTIHFGQDVHETIQCFYGKLGDGRWNWRSVRDNPDSVRSWMLENWRQLKRLKFGNHRKRRIMNPAHQRGTAAVVGSFVQWVSRLGGGSPYVAFASLAHNAFGKEAAFDAMYQEFDVLDFGRTARFDLLCLLANLRLFPIAPGHCYLKGATGPRHGALLMVTGAKKKRFTWGIEETVRDLRSHLGVPVEAMEDALCNWQKKSKRKAHMEAAAGFISVACG